MVVDKTLEIVYDLTSINQQQMNELVAANEKIIKKASTTQKQFTGIPKTQKEEGLRKIFGRQTFSTLVNVGTNPLAFIQGHIVKLIPFIGAALLVTGVIAAFVKRIDDFQKEFVDNVDDRIDVFRTKQQQALTQAGLQQLIITSASGSAEPRDAYNTFQVFNTDQSRIEADFRIRDTAGVD